MKMKYQTMAMKIKSNMKTKLCESNEKRQYDEEENIGEEKQWSNDQ